MSSQDLNRPAASHPGGAGRSVSGSPVEIVPETTPGRHGSVTQSENNAGMKRVLVIEDESDIRGVLKFNLERAGYSVDAVCRGEDGLRLARSGSLDLILLDLMLPDMQGTDICKELKRSRETKDIPVMILSARGDEVDRVLGFELGAEDYIVKPFSIRELLLRIQSLLGRGRSVASGGHEVEFGALRLDRDAFRVWVEDDELSLTALEFRLLLALYDRRGRVQSRARLLDDVWGIQASIDTRTVDTHIRRLREKLRGARGYVQTVRGVGYRFATSPPDPMGRRFGKPPDARGSSGKG